MYSTYIICYNKFYHWKSIYLLSIRETLAMAVTIALSERPLPNTQQGDLRNKTRREQRKWKYWMIRHGLLNIVMYWHPCPYQNNLLVENVRFAIHYLLIIVLVVPYQTLSYYVTVLSELRSATAVKHFIGVETFLFVFQNLGRSTMVLI